MTVAVDFVAQRPDHLRMTVVAAFADIDVAACKLQRRVRTYAAHGLDRAFEVVQRHDLDQSADRDHQQGQDHHQD